LLTGSRGGEFRHAGADARKLERDQIAGTHGGQYSADRARRNRCGNSPRAI
jgi:hypothetical protein